MHLTVSSNLVLNLYLILKKSKTIENCENSKSLILANFENLHKTFLHLQDKR